MSVQPKNSTYSERFYRLQASNQSAAHWPETDGQGEHPLQMYVGAGGFTVFVVPAKATANSAAPTNRQTLSHANRLVLLHEAIEKLAGLPEGHDMRIDPVTKERAEEFLNLVGQDGHLPKLFPDGEALVFTWDMGQRKRMITIDGEEVSGMDIDRRSRIRCDYDLDFEPAARMQWLPKMFSGVLSSSSASDE